MPSDDRDINSKSMPEISELTNEEAGEFSEKMLRGILGSDFAGIIPRVRPRFQLRSLPMKVRWEITRRHPHYQKLWKYSVAFHQGQSTTDQVEQLQRATAAQILGGIGVSGEPPNPATTFSELGEADLNNAWLSGAVHTITLRGMAELLLASLSKETIGQVGLYFMEAGVDESKSGPSKQELSMEKLMKYQADDLDSYLEEPFVSINPAASQRKVSEAINELLSGWKKERKLTEQRDRSDKISKYLDIWDSREGWTEEGSYDVTCEKTMKQIAIGNKIAIPTISNQYRNAFQLIIGEEYSPKLWWETMGTYKVNSFDLLRSTVSKKRPTKSPIRLPIPEATLGANIESIIDKVSSGNSSEEYTMNEAAMDAKELIEKGLSDNEIIGILGSDNKRSEWLDLLTWYRSRDDENNLIKK